MVVTPGIVLGLRFCVVMLYKRVTSTMKGTSVGFTQFWYLAMLLLFTFLIYLTEALYLACRVYLVVESFVSVANLLEAMYELPVWSAYFPHIS